MSNHVCLQRCEFIDYPDRSVTYGFRAYDGYDQTYLNTASPAQLAMDPIEFLEWVKENVDDNCLSEMFAFIEENEHGIYIDASWYGWEEIRQILPDPAQTKSSRAEETQQPPSPKEQT